MDTEEYRKKIELKILEIMEQKLKDGKMNAQRAKEIAKYVLNTLRPYMNLSQIHAVVQEFDDRFPELVPVVLEVSRNYEEQIKEVVLRHASRLLKQGKLDEANCILKQATNKQSKLRIV
ncbi:MAG: hypothetical protein N2558_02550 [Patescibacteria group bacterium]|nr:hypothetical protein [Patescibacteria group bacterium]